MTYAPSSSDWCTHTDWIKTCQYTQSRRMHTLSSNFLWAHFMLHKTEQT